MTIYLPGWALKTVRLNLTFDKIITLNTIINKLFEGNSPEFLEKRKTQILPRVNVLNLNNHYYFRLIYQYILD